MTQIEVSFDAETLRKVLLGDKGAEVLLEKVMNEVLQAEMTEHLGAEPGEHTDDRRGYRNGSYERELTTRIGSLKLEVPRDRDGTFQTKLFERYQRSEKALVTTLMQMVLQGVSTRRVKKITTELCGREFSRQTVSNLTERLSEQVRAWAERPLEEEYPFLLADAMQLNIRHHEAVRSAMALIVVGISEDGYREILGLKIALRETGESWKELLQELKDRGLRRVELATSDAHEGLERALREAFPGCIWQRCQSHFRRNVIDKTPSDYQDRMHRLLDQILKADSQQEASQRLEEVSGELKDEAENALDVLEEGIFDATAVLALPEKYRERLRTTNMVERLIQEVRRREKVIRIFPNKTSAWRLVGALLAEKHEEWSTGRRYWTMDEFFQWRGRQTGDNTEDLQTESSNRILQPA
ncbi:IS256 family transposase [Salinibacter ruber]|uniref:Mutator family transposase n=1 Tax=Salinibacter ruber TaxID=146919 RepID=A0A9X2Z5T7_9BACT|nr:IS256 family transposase [Salinibacter ruber]MCS3953313.1 transposase-like protein [Salinibacter ruber]